MLRSTVAGQHFEDVRNAQQQLLSLLVANSLHTSTHTTSARLRTLVKTHFIAPQHSAMPTCDINIAILPVRHVPVLKVQTFVIAPLT